jgi:hypothetical protein
MQKFCKKKLHSKTEWDTSCLHVMFTRVLLKVNQDQDEVYWFIFIEIYIFEGKNVQLLQKKKLFKNLGINITLLLHVLNCQIFSFKIETNLPYFESFYIKTRVKVRLYLSQSVFGWIFYWKFLQFYIQNCIFQYIYTNFPYNCSFKKTRVKVRLCLSYTAFNSIFCKSSTFLPSKMYISIKLKQFTLFKSFLRKNVWRWDYICLIQFLSSFCFAKCLLCILI